MTEADAPPPPPPADGGAPPHLHHHHHHHHHATHHRETGPLPVGASAAAGHVPPRKVLRVDAHGRTTYVLADRHTLALSLGVPYRDFRVIDPITTDAAANTIFIRDRAIGVALEGVRAVVCADQVVVLAAPPAPAAAPPLLPAASGPGGGAAAGPPAPNAPFVRDLVERLAGCFPSRDSGLPYELRALEAVLATAAKRLEEDAAALDAAATPALEGLGAGVSRDGLDRVRAAKASLARLAARAAAFKAALDAILSDDADMDALYLSRKAAAAGGAAAGGDGGDAAPAPPAPAPPPAPPIFVMERTRSMRSWRMSTADDGGGGNGGNPSSSRRASAAGPGDDDDASVRTVAWLRPPVDPADVADCENLLDAYLARVAACVARLDGLRDRAAAAEALARLDLDRRRNDLVAFNMALSMGSVSLALISAVGSAFGQNLYFSSAATPAWAWHAATWSAVATAAALLAGLLAHAKRRRLLFIPSEE